MTRSKSLLLASAAAAILGTGAAHATTTNQSGTNQSGTNQSGTNNSGINNSGTNALPSYSGTVKHFTITPRGTIDGVILGNGTDVMFPPYLSTQIAYAVKLGDKVTIHGLKAANEPVVQGVSITDSATNRSVTDNGPPAGFGPGPHGAPTRMMVQGKVAQYLYGPNGQKNGVLLTDGTALHMPPPALAKSKIAALIKPGDHVAAVGAGTKNVLGSVVMVQEIGSDFKDLTHLALPRPPGMGPHGWHGGPAMMHMRAMMMRGPMGGPMGGPGAPPPPPPPPAPNGPAATTTSK